MGGGGGVERKTMSSIVGAGRIESCKTAGFP